MEAIIIRRGPIASERRRFGHMADQRFLPARDVLRRFHELTESRPRQPFGQWLRDLRMTLGELTGVLRQHHDLLQEYRARHEQNGEPNGEPVPSAAELLRFRELFHLAPECYLATDL